MGRVIETEINGVKYTTTVEGKYYVDGFWSSPYYDVFSVWKGYLEKSIKFFEKEAKRINKDIIDFNEKYPLLRVKISNGEEIEWDGCDQYWDELTITEEMANRVYSIVLINCYAEFESTLRKICNSLHETNDGIAKPTEKLRYIDECKSFLKKNVDFKLTGELLKLWSKIDLYRELRNLFAHNDNPVNTDDKKERKRLDKIKQIDKENIEVTKNDFVVIKNKIPVLKFIELCDKFIQNLHSDLIKIKY